MIGKQKKVPSPAVPNLGRHESGCKVCAHPRRQEIEREFVSWKSPARITAEYKLRNRASIYRHAHAFDLFAKRARNLRAALERLIERVDEVPVNAGAIVQAITAYAKINSQGQFVERNEHVNMNDLFDKMNIEELEQYAANGTLPSWFPLAVGATPNHGPEGDGDE
jgi:hypothetical protein